VLSPSPADRGQMIRNIPVLGGIDDLDDVIEEGFEALHAGTKMKVLVDPTIVGSAS